MNTSGLLAERSAAFYLKGQGYKIVDRNWRHPTAEIDVIARLNGTVYFVEVKYRRHAASGSPLEYITSEKLHRMQRAAELWVQESKWEGDYRLAAIALEGNDFTVSELVLL